MQHYGMALNLKDDPELIEKYKEHHRHPWPEALQGIREVGITDMKIFLLGPHLFMYMTAVDGFDPGRDLPRYVEQNPKAAEWNELMCTFQEKVEEAGEDEWWALMEMVYDMQDHI